MSFEEKCYNKVENRLFRTLNSTNDVDNENIWCQYCLKNVYSKTYMKPSTFNEIVNKYVNKIIRRYKETGNEKLLYTFPRNNIQLQNCKNGLYIDIDYHYKEEFASVLEKDNVSMANIIIQTISKMFKGGVSGIFCFVPTTYNDCKGGIHILIYCTVDMIDSNREKFITMLIKRSTPSILKYLHKTTIDSNDITLKDILDPQPIKSKQIILPFAQKDKESRRYKLLNVEDIKEDIIYCVQPEIEDKEYMIKESIPDYNPIINIGVNNNNNITYDDDINDDPSTAFAMDENGNIFHVDKLLHEGTFSRLIYDFVVSIKYLNKYHVLWCLIAKTELPKKYNARINNKDRNMTAHNYFYNMIGYIYKMIIFVKIMESHGESDFYGDFDKSINNNYIFEAILQLLISVFHKLFRLTHSNVKTNNRNDTSKMMEQCKSIWYNKFIAIVCNNDVLNNKNNDKDYEDKYKRMSFVEAVMTYKYSKSSQSDKDTKNALQRFINKFIYIHFKEEILKKFIINFVDLFKDNLTNEIEPFDETKSYTHQICTDKETNEELTYMHVDPSRNETLTKTTYSETLSLWFRVFMIFSYINANYDINLAITETIEHFINNYYIIVNSELKQNNNRRLLIYNVEQCDDLEAYPNHQWIIDNSCNILKKWVGKLYYYYVKDEFKLCNKDYGLYGFIKLLNVFKFDSAFNVKLMSIREFSSISKCLKVLVDDLIESRISKAYECPNYIPIESSDMFPMYNGWLLFHRENRNGKDDEIIEFSKNNKQYYTSGFTNCIWVGNYEEYIKCCERNEEMNKAFKDVNHMIETIYKKEEERDYNMSLFASVLYGGDNKNMIHVMYGTGSDGKSTIMNALIAMLGKDSSESRIKYPIMINGVEYVKQLRSLDGLSCIIKPESLMCAPKNGSEHDEGGKANMIHKRLTVTAEPSTSNDGKLCGSVIKDITSGSYVSTRGIFKESVMARLNSLITWQTNIQPSTDDTSYGFKRRLSVYQHRTKFLPSNEMKGKQYENVEEIDSELNNKFETNIYYRQALFYILLRYAINNIRNGWNELQLIPKPLSVIKNVEQVLNNSTGEVNWLYRHVVEATDDNINDFNIINIKYLIDIIKQHASADGIRINLKDLIGIIQNQFDGNIFKLDDKYYNKTTKTKKLVMIKKFKEEQKELEYFINGLSNPNINTKQLNSCNNFEKDAKIYKEKYLTKTAITSTICSNSPDFKDLFIVGYIYINDEEDIVDDEL